MSVAKWEILSQKLMIGKLTGAISNRAISALMNMLFDPPAITICTCNENFTKPVAHI